MTDHNMWFDFVEACITCSRVSDDGLQVADVSTHFCPFLWATLLRVGDVSKNLITILQCTLCIIYEEIQYNCILNRLNICCLMCETFDIADFISK